MENFNIEDLIKNQNFIDFLDNKIQTTINNKITEEGIQKQKITLPEEFNVDLQNQFQEQQQFFESIQQIEEQNLQQSSQQLVKFVEELDEQVKKQNTHFQESMERNMQHMVKSFKQIVMDSVVTIQESAHETMHKLEKYKKLAIQLDQNQSLNYNNQDTQVLKIQMEQINQRMDTLQQEINNFQNHENGSNCSDSKNDILQMEKNFMINQQNQIQQYQNELQNKLTGDIEVQNNSIQYMQEQFLQQQEELSDICQKYTQIEEKILSIWNSIGQLHTEVENDRQLYIQQSDKKGILGFFKK